MNRPTRIAAIVAFNALLLLALLALLEGVARLLPQLEAPPLFEDPEMFVKGRPFVMDHPTRGFALRPDFENERYRINSAGFRGPDLPEDRRGRLLILALGESTTFGWRVGEDETYPHQLQRFLAEAGVDGLVVNGGTPSYTSTQVLIYLKELLPRLEPDLVVVNVIWNDIWFSSVANWYPELLVIRAPPPWRRWLGQHSALFRRVALRDRDPGGSVDHMNEAALALYARNLDEIARVCARRDTPLVFMQPAFTVSGVPPSGGTPMGQGHFSRAFVLVLARRYAEAMAEVAERRGVPVVDHRLSLRSLRQGWLFLDAIHPKPRGNLLMAEDVGGVLLESGLLDLTRDRAR